MLKTKSGKRQRDLMKNRRATERSMRTGPEGHVREIVEEPAHDFRMKGAIGSGTLLDTVFHVREAGFEVEKRVVASRAPIVRTSNSADRDSYYAELINIPSRPDWTASMTGDEMHKCEDESFELYLQDIYAAYPPYRLNHFEHNLHVWRQLWRVVDISDILVLCADARHPLFHVPPSLYDYIVHKCRKPMILILNKIDFISSTALAGWIADFATRFPLLTCVPFSSFPHEKTITNPDADTVQLTKRKAIQHDKNKAGGKKDQIPPYGIDNLLKVLDEVWRKKSQRDDLAKAAAAASAATAAQAQSIDPNWRPTRMKNKKAAFAKLRESAAELQSTKEGDTSVDIMQGIKDVVQLQTDVALVAHQAEVARAEAEAKDEADGKHKKSVTIIDNADDDDDDDDDDVDAPVAAVDSHIASVRFGALSSASAAAASESAAAVSAAADMSHITVGMIGHPNVGKSSLINALFSRSVVTVSETPGKTKHLQTLTLNSRMNVCDCPGLVFPAVDMPRALQVLCGIFPISQLREPYSSVQYLASRVDLPAIYNLATPTVDGILQGKGIDTTGAGSKAKKSSMMTASGGKKVNKAKGRDMSHRGGDDDDDNNNDPFSIDGSSSSIDVFAELQIAEATLQSLSYVWSAWDICESYARMRNYSIKGSKGLYDTQRAANDILHDALSGVVLLTFAPPAAGGRQVPMGQPSAATPIDQARAAKKAIIQQKEEDDEEDDDEDEEDDEEEDDEEEGQKETTVSASSSSTPAASASAASVDAP